MPTSWTFCGFALDRGRAAGTGEGSAVCYVKSETAFWAVDDSSLARTHFDPLLISESASKMVKNLSEDV